MTGEEFRRRRIAANVTIGTVARDAGLSKQAVSKFEQGKMRPAHATAVILYSVLFRHEDAFAEWFGKMTPGQRIGMFRRMRGWSREELAEKIGVRVGKVCEMEQGRAVCRCEHLHSLANVFNVTMDYLYAGIVHVGDVVYDNPADYGAEEFLSTQEGNNK